MADQDFFNAHKSEFNCYDYATGYKDDPSEVIGSIPGAASGAPMKHITEIELRTGLIKDGAIPVAADDFNNLPLPRAGHRLIAAVISPDGNGDFHFYRQEKNGLWTHKPARTEVQHTDAAGQPITDPRFAARDYTNVIVNGWKWPLNYKHFAGFYSIPEEGIKTGKAPPPQPHPFLGAQKNMGISDTPESIMESKRNRPQLRF